MKACVSWLARWLLAAVIIAAIGSVVQTQYNMGAITGMGHPVPLGERLAATGADLLRFGPFWTLFVALALLPAFAVAAGLIRWAGWTTDPVRRQTLYGVAAFAGVLLALLILNAIAPMTPIAASRSLGGAIALALPGLAGGWLFARLARTG